MMRSGSSQGPRSGRRKIVMVFVGLALVGAGLLVFRYANEIAGQISGYIAPPPEGGDPTGLGTAQFGYLPFIVWGFGFTLIGFGGNTLRMAFMSSVAGGMGVGGMGGGAMAGGMSPEMLDGYMQQTLAANRGMTGQSAATAAPATKEVVKVKCRNCGSLESEDAAFCRKCGKSL